MPAARDNTGKPDLVQMLDFGTALDDVVAVLDQGAIKYEPGNWLLGGKPDSEYLSAAMRHIGKHRRGQVYDPETGVKHLASAAWNLLAALGLNYGAFPSIDPNFDQEAYAAKHQEPKPVPRSGDQVIFYPGHPVAVEPGQRRVAPSGLEYLTLKYKPGIGWRVHTVDGDTYDGWSGYDIAGDVLLGRAD